MACGALKPQFLCQLPGCGPKALFRKPAHTQHRHVHWGDLTSRARDVMPGGNGTDQLAHAHGRLDLTDDQIFPRKPAGNQSLASRSACPRGSLCVPVLLAMVRSLTPNPANAPHPGAPRAKRANSRRCSPLPLFSRVRPECATSGLLGHAPQYLLCLRVQGKHHLHENPLSCPLMPHNRRARASLSAV